MVAFGGVRAVGEIYEWNVFVDRNLVSQEKVPTLLPIKLCENFCINGILLNKFRLEKT